MSNLNNWNVYEWDEKPTWMRIVDCINRPVYWLLGAKTVQVRQVHVPSIDRVSREYIVGDAIKMDRWTIAACAVYCLIIPLLIVPITLLASYLYKRNQPESFSDGLTRWEKVESFTPYIKILQDKLSAATDVLEKLKSDIAAAEQRQDLSSMEKKIDELRALKGTIEQQTTAIVSACHKVTNIVEESDILVGGVRWAADKRILAEASQASERAMRTLQDAEAISRRTSIKINLSQLEELEAKRCSFVNNLEVIERDIKDAEEREDLSFIEKKIEELCALKETIEQQATAITLVRVKISIIPCESNMAHVASANEMLSKVTQDSERAIKAIQDAKDVYMQVLYNLVIKKVEVGIQSAAKQAIPLAIWARDALIKAAVKGVCIGAATYFGLDASSLDGLEDAEKSASRVYGQV